MFFAAIARARAAPSTRTRSMKAASSFSRFISAPIGPSFATARSTRADLKAEKLPPPNTPRHFGFRLAVQRGIDADEIVRFRPLREAFDLGRQRLRVGLRLANFLRDRVGIVGEIDPRIIRRVRFRHFLGPVAQTHDSRGGALE